MTRNPLSRRFALSLFDNNTLSEHREETVSTYNHLRVTAILNFCLRNNPARLLAAARGKGGRGGRGKNGGHGGWQGEEEGSTSFPRSSQWVYSNTERCRGREKDRVRGKRKKERERTRMRETRRDTRTATEIPDIWESERDGYSGVTNANLGS